MRFEVFMAVNFKIVVPWILTLNILVGGYQCFVWKLKVHYCIHSNPTMNLK
jgi:hypothetical protein